MLDEVQQRPSQLSQPKGLATNEGVKRKAADERLLLRQGKHRLELICDHLPEIGSRLRPGQHDRAVVDLDRIWHAEKRTSTSSHPERLIIRRPIHQILI